MFTYYFGFSSPWSGAGLGREWGGTGAGVGEWGGSGAGAIKGIHSHHSHPHGY